MMLRYTFGEDAALLRIEKMRSKSSGPGLRTGDIYERRHQKVGTKEMGDAVIAALA